jgi:hypothetical protein
MKFLCALCVLSCLVPALALDREAFTFTNYVVNVRIEPEQHRLAVRGRIKLRNDSAVAQKNLVLQISSTLEWRSIQIDGTAAQFETHKYTTDIDHTGALSEAIVSLPREVAPKATVAVDIGYEGVIGLDTTRLTRIGVPEDKAKHSDWDQISKSFTGVRGIGYVAWYPVATEAASLIDGNSVGSAVGRWKRRETDAEMQMDFCAASGETQFALVRLSSPLRRTAQANTEETPEASWTCVTRRVLGLGIMAPMLISARYSVQDYARFSIAYLPGHRPGAEAYGVAAELAVPLVTDWFGASPQKAQVAELPDSEAAAFESGVTLLTPLGNTDSRVYQLTAVHQLTHTAFHSLRPWMYEGAAHFAQALLRYQQSGLQAALDFMESHRPPLVEAEKAAAKQADHDTAESLITTTTEEFYRSKAMYVWWMLRDMVGDAGLKKALAAYHREQDTNPAYLQRLVEVQAARDLGWFFDDWVYHDRGLPDFRVASVFSRPLENGRFLVTITVENLGRAGAEVPVLLRMEGGEVRQRVEVRGLSKASIRIEASSKPLEVVINDGSVPESDTSNNTYKIESVNH